MKRYAVEEFITNHPTAKADTVKTLVSKKVSLLYDFGLLEKNKHQPDPREEEVRAVLKRCKTETAMTTLLHDVLKGECTIDAMLKKERMLC